MGTSGWSYKEWEGIFYPSHSTPKLKFYSGIFNTVEVDSSFYAMPKPDVVYGWVKNTPSNFIFSLKLPKTITHDMRLKRTDELEKELTKFLDIISPLSSSGKLGVILAQLPPSLESDLELLKRFLQLLPREQFRFAVEFRHPSWWRKETWALLQKMNVANTIVDEPLLPSEAIVTADFAYIRWHGHGENVWYDYRYNEKEIEDWAKKLKELRGNEIYGYWNNHFHGYAVLNCLEELRAIGMLDKNGEEMLQKVRKSIDSPRTLFDFV